MMMRKIKVDLGTSVFIEQFVHGITTRRVSGAYDSGRCVNTSIEKPPIVSMWF